MSKYTPSKKTFQILLGVLIVILLVFGLLRMKFGQFLPDAIDKNLPDAVIIAAVGIMLWNHQILNQQKKEEEARKAAEAAAAAEAEEGEGDSPSKGSEEEDSSDSGAGKPEGDERS